MVVKGLLWFILELSGGGWLLSCFFKGAAWWSIVNFIVCYCLLLVGCRLVFVCVYYYYLCGVKVCAYLCFSLPACLVFNFLNIIIYKLVYRGNPNVG